VGCSTAAPMRVSDPDRASPGRRHRTHPRCRSSGTCGYLWRRCSYPQPPRRRCSCRPARGMTRQRTENAANTNRLCIQARCCCRDATGNGTYARRRGTPATRSSVGA
jgi:hypothetical protein